jgi:hypothetical protein
MHGIRCLLIYIVNMCVILCADDNNDAVLCEKIKSGSCCAHQAAYCISPDLYSALLYSCAQMTTTTRCCLRRSRAATVVHTKQPPCIHCPCCL